MHNQTQMYNYADKLGLNKDGKDAYRGHEFFVTPVRICKKWGQMSFDLDYQTRELRYFEPVVCKISTRLPFDPTVPPGQA